MPERNGAMENPVGYLRHVLSQVAEQGLSLLGRAGRSSNAPARLSELSLPALARLLLTSRGEASGVAIAREIMGRYAGLPMPERLAFLLTLARDFGPDRAAITAAYAAYSEHGDAETLHALTEAVEAPRQDILRRLNLAPGNTLGLVRMREDLLDHLRAEPDLKALDQDFVHLFSSWFNRGFLMLKRIDWQSPAHVLEKIIKYEAVHAIRSWDDLRRRIDPPDRRCYAFFHPALADEPLIFVEVALTVDVPGAIEPILSEQREALPVEAIRTAVFYSISNCQRGLSSISFGSFLIKQVAEDLKREMPGISTFVTLSPVPGFRAWVEAELAKPDSPFLDEATRAALQTLEDTEVDPETLAAFQQITRRLLARYFLDARDPRGRVIDPVARFHLGNGARLERLNPLADFSQKGWRDSYAAMVNYLYDLAAIEENHEQFAIRGIVAHAPAVQKALADARQHRPSEISRAS